jgi:peptidoglycan/xylan/chitin deacetylase (PgdA/CDA1 family)
MLDRRAFIASFCAAVAAACSAGRKPAAGQSAAPSSASSSPAPTSGAASAAPVPAQSQTPSPDRAGFLSAGPRDRQHVALTFHVNGDPALATRLLDLLRADHVPITAFMVGNWLDGNHDIGVRFVDDGHEIANHTYTHLVFPQLDRSAMTSEVVGCRDAIQRLIGSPGRFFRPSGTANGTDDPGPAVLDVARAAGYQTVVGYDVDPADYQDPGADAVSRRTIAAVQPGSIVSLHFGHEGTIEALPSILTALQARGLAPVTMSTLLA